MELPTPKYCPPHSLFASQEESQEMKRGKQPLEKDPICKLNLKETAEFVKSLPTAQRRRERDHNNNVILNAMARRSIEAPSTPGRPIFGFSLPRKSLPSKWEDAQKWLITASSHHPLNNHAIKHSEVILQKPIPSHNEVVKGVNNNANGLIKGTTFCKQESNVFGDKSKVVINCEISSHVCLEENYHHHQFNGAMDPTDVPLKDKYTDEIGPVIHNMRHLEPTKEAFLFKCQKHEKGGMKDAYTEVIPLQEEVKHRDVGTEMTPLGSSTTSRCNTPFMSTSPPRHNTPATRSGPLALVAQTHDITKQLRECHLANLHFGSVTTNNWSSREEEEEDISKSLRHFEIGRRSVSVSESRVSVWEEQEKAKSCLRYQREEAKIEAWLNLQTAKAEAQTRKLEVKIQKMRSDLEEKLMKRKTIIDKKAEEWRATAQVEHCEQIRKPTERALKHHHKLINTHFSPSIVSCGCFPTTYSIN